MPRSVIKEDTSHYDTKLYNTLLTWADQDLNVLISLLFASFIRSQDSLVRFNLRERLKREGLLKSVRYFIVPQNVLKVYFTHIHYNTPQFNFHFLYKYSVLPTMLLCLLLFTDHTRLCTSKFSGRHAHNGERNQRILKPRKTDKQDTQLCICTLARYVVVVFNVFHFYTHSFSAFDLLLTVNYCSSSTLKSLFGAISNNSIRTW